MAAGIASRYKTGLRLHTYRQPLTMAAGIALRPAVYKIGPRPKTYR